MHVRVPSAGVDVSERELRHGGHSGFKRYLGVARGSRAHVALLPLARACAHDRACLYPPDAAGNANQRRDQSAFNAARCALEKRGDAFRCAPDRRFWMWRGQHAFPPPDDAADWSAMVLFSRRGPGPYEPVGG